MCVISSGEIVERGLVEEIFVNFKYVVIKELFGIRNEYGD